MKVLLINPPKEKEFALFVLDDYNTKARSNQLPIGLMYLASYLKSDHDIEILDMNALEIPIKSIYNIINKNKPDLIGITCVIAKWNTVRELSKEIKKYFDIPIVLGGINPSLYPFETLQYKYIDYVISGFGQIPFKELCDQLEQNKFKNNIYNCYTKNSNHIEGRFDFVDIDEFPFPDRTACSMYLYTIPHFPQNPVTSMVTSLGCPYKCKFCACKNFQPVQIRKARKLIDEMIQVEDMGIKSILFQDELFTMSANRIKDICSLMIRDGIQLKWSIRSRANLVNENALSMMKEAGCFNVHLGIESGTDKILNKMGKKLNIKTIEESVKMIKKIGLNCTASFMLGYLDETEDDINNTIDFACNLDLDSCQFYITQPEPNTELYEEVKSIKELPDDIYKEFTLNPDKVDLRNNIASNYFNKEQMMDFLRLAYSKTRNLYKINNINLA